METAASKSRRLQAASQGWGQTLPQMPGNGFSSPDLSISLYKLALTVEEHYPVDIFACRARLDAGRDALQEHRFRVPPGSGLVRQTKRLRWTWAD